MKKRCLSLALVLCMVASLLSQAVWAADADYSTQVSGDCGQSVTIDSRYYPESEHNYAENADETQILTVSGASSITLTFGENSETEQDYDHIFVLDQNNALVETLSGYLEGKSVTVPGNIVKLNLKSDSSVTRYGYCFSSITATVAHKADSPVISQGYAATCTAPGLKDTQKCTQCQQTFGGEQISVLGHDAPAGVCARCGLQVCGNNLTWAINGDTLTISGTGDMYEYDMESLTPSAPWRGRTDYNKVVIGEGVTSIGMEAFDDCDNITSVSLPDSLQRIGSWAFFDCGALQTVTIPAAMTDLGHQAFCYCYALTSIEVDPENEVYASDASGVMYNKSFIELVQFPNGYEGSYVIPESTQFIAQTAFWGSENLTEVTLSKGITELFWESFVLCGALTAIRVAEGNPAFSSKDGFLYDPQQNTLILAPSGLTGNVTIPAGTVQIGENAFTCADVMTEVTIPDSVSSLHDYAFYGCDALETVRSMGSIEHIGMGVFEYCAELKNVNIPNTVEYIDYGAFRCCESLENLTLPASVTDISYMSFGDCYSLVNVTIPKTTVSIYNSFKNCYNLNHVLYTGSETDWINADYYDDALMNAEDRHYNATGNEVIFTDGMWYCTLCQKQLSAAPSGDSPEGWVYEDGNWVYYEDGEKLCSTWKQDSTGWCYLTADGTMATNQWIQDSQGWCYVGDSGYCVTNTWKQDSIGWCYLNAEGRMAVNTWIQDSQSWCFVGDSGYCVTNTWKQDSIGWCYLNAEGRMAVNTWIQDSQGWCYVGADGYCVTKCWKQDSTGWCYLNAEGRMAVNQWIEDSVGWCYVDASGYMVTNTTVDGYWIGADGYWVQ